MRLRDYAKLYEGASWTEAPEFRPNPRELARQLLALAARYEAEVPALASEVRDAEQRVHDAKAELAAAQSGAAEARQWAAELLGP